MTVRNERGGAYTRVSVPRPWKGIPPSLSNLHWVLTTQTKSPVFDDSPAPTCVYKRDTDYKLSLESLRCKLLRRYGLQTEQVLCTVSIYRYFVGTVKSYFATSLVPIFDSRFQTALSDIMPRICIRFHDKASLTIQTVAPPIGSTSWRALAVMRIALESLQHQERKTTTNLAIVWRYERRPPEKTGSHITRFVVMIIP